MKNKTLGTYLKELRTANDYTQEFVANQLDLVRQTYSNYESDTRKPKGSTLYKIASFYNIDVNLLLQLTLTEDENVYYDAPNPAENSISEFLEYASDPFNEKKLKYMNKREKELIYYFNKLPITEQEDIVSFLQTRSKRF